MSMGFSWVVVPCARARCSRWRAVRQEVLTFGATIYIRSLLTRPFGRMRSSIKRMTWPFASRLFFGHSPDFAPPTQTEQNRGTLNRRKYSFDKGIQFKWPELFV